MFNRPRPCGERGCLPRWIVVPPGPLELAYAPDGLTEAYIDTLIAQTAPPPPRSAGCVLLGIPGQGASAPRAGVDLPAGLDGEAA